MTVLKKAIIKSYAAAEHKATVQIAGSLGVWLDGIRVATDIPAADVVAGRQCTVLFLDPSNQDDAVVITIQGALPSAGAGSSHAPIGACYPGVLSVSTPNAVAPQVPYRGAAFTIDKLYCRLAVAPQLQDAKVKIWRNGTSMGEVTITKSTKAGELDVNVPVSSGDYFEAEITQTGITPNEGSDLVWLCVP